MKLTYAVTPPNHTTAPERQRVIAAAQSARIAALPIDALLVYDLQDEAARTGVPRPFPFVPKVDALTYAYEQLHTAVPRVVYRSLAGLDESSLHTWLCRLAARDGKAVFVGAPSRASDVTLTLPQSFALCRSRTPRVCFGGVLIAERHQKRGDEDSRAWCKAQQGCRFFVSQTVWSVDASTSLLRDLHARAELARSSLAPILLTLSPCGSEQTLQFQEWLGVHVPAAIKRELRTAKDMLARSVDLAVEVFAQVQTVALELGLSVGCNVESVSSRVCEIEASLELVRRIARLQADLRVNPSRKTARAPKGGLEPYLSSSGMALGPFPSVAERRERG